MHVIRSAEALSRLVATYPILRLKADLLEECEDLATVVVVQPHDSLDALDSEIGWPLVSGALLTKPAELIEREDGWQVVTFILSDWGEGLILLVPDDANPALVEACRTEDER